jgi:hypothetical protein
MSASITTTTSFMITIPEPQVLAVLLSSATAPSGAAGAVVGAVTLELSSGASASTSAVTLGGAAAGSFALTNNGVIPCNLVVGATALTPGTYDITLSAS